MPLVYRSFCSATLTLAALLGVAFGTPTGSQAQSLDYSETFALATDRDQALKQLIPGTEQYYYYHCLHYQHLGKFEQVEKLMEAWTRRNRNSPLLQQIRNRQALLTYSQQPQATLDYLINHLNLRFDHRAQLPDARPELPAKIAPAQLDRKSRFQQLLRTNPNLDQFEDSALAELATMQLSAQQRRVLLQRLQEPDTPNLVSMVASDLQTRESRGFGSLPVHGRLLKAQLEELLKLRPQLRNESAFVLAYLAKLAPSDDVDWRTHPTEKLSYLRRLWDYASPLPAVHNSLKVNILYHLLDMQRQQGTYDRKLFLDYLALPRASIYVNPKHLEKYAGPLRANLNANFQSQIHLPVVGNDEPLVRDFLTHFLVEAEDYKAFDELLNSNYLSPLFASVKLMAGVGDPERWFSMLSPAQYQELKDRVELNFVPTNQRIFSTNEPVALEVDVKNVDKLIVKVFYVNTTNYYRQTAQPLNTDINLDGLVANQEETYEYDLPPIRRARRKFEFPQLKKEGVYVIDLIGNGQSSRVLVQKGMLRFLVKSQGKGHVFRVLNEANQLITDASIWMGGQQFDAEDDGLIYVPFSTQPGRQPIVVSRGEFSVLHHFNHEAENFQLQAGFYVDRESVIANRKATLIVRPSLQVNGTPISLTRLQNVRLFVHSTDLDGVPTSKEIPNFAIQSAHESEHEFQVPPRVASLRFELQADVSKYSTGETQSLSASQTFSVNEAMKTNEIIDWYLARVGDGYQLEAHGRNGELLENRQATVALKHQDLRQPLSFALATDTDGRIELGNLSEFTTITAGPRTWHLDGDRHSYPAVVHGHEGSPVYVPFMANELTREQVSLFATTHGQLVRDEFDRMQLERGLLKLVGLGAGDYTLLLKSEGRRIPIRITAGRLEYGFYLGDYRQLESKPAPLQIYRVAAEGNQVKIYLANSSEFTRVHVFATRFEPAFDAFAEMDRVRDATPYWSITPPVESYYAQGRDIGDEYRYILDRRYARRFPGNMLDHPSVLLNPWPVRSTEAEEQRLQEGQAFGRAPAAEAARGGRARDARRQAANPTDPTVIEFLAHSSVSLINLSPNEQGIVTIPRDAFPTQQSLRIVALDPDDTVLRQWSLSESQTLLVDQRLRDGLDPKGHYTQQQQVTMLQAGSTFTLADISASEFQAYDTLARVYRLYMTLTQNQTLAEFRFVLDWPTLSLSEKQEKYAKYACHELNFFLAHKDPEFFQNVVQPYLKNKRSKMFLDQWLVGQPLQEHLAPWNHQRLNLVEKILLAQRIDGESSFTSQLVSELNEVRPVDLTQLVMLFDSAVSSGKLDASDASLGLLEAKRALDKSRSQARFAVPGTAGRPGMRAGGGFGGGGSSGGLGGFGGQGQGQPRDAAAAAPAAPKPAANRASQERLGELMEKAKEARSELSRRGRQMDRKSGTADDYFADEDAEKESLLRQLYRKLDKTQEWAENHYYRLPLDQQNSDLITVNDFWNDYAQHDPSKPFYSRHLAQPNRNFAEMMFALAVLDLPFQAEEHESSFEGATMRLKAGSPMIVFHEEIQPASSVAGQTPILVSQNFFREGDRFRTVNNKKLDKFVTDEFLIGTVYGCQIVVTNPTSAPQQMDILLQVPEGAIPLANGQKTKSTKIELAPFNSQKIEYFFYFPEPGQYQHYPVHVSSDGEVLAFAPPATFKVVERLSKVDTESWVYISQQGSNEEVVSFLKNQNLQRIDLSAIAFRMQDKAFFGSVLELLAQRHAYDQTLWSYSLKHGDVTSIRQYLQHQDALVSSCGAALDSPLLTIDPVKRHTYEHLDYRPLVNARTHQVGETREILNQRFREQYLRLMSILCCQPGLSSDHWLAVTYYLVLQSRIEEALEAFQRVNPDELATRLQYDYFTAYLSFYLEDLTAADQIAQQYLNHPVDSWRKAFENVHRQVEEVKGQVVTTGDQQDRTQAQTDLANREPAFDLKVEAKQIRLDYQNLQQVQVNFYLMDIELLFSRNPFVQSYGSQFAYIRPNATLTVDLNASESNVTIPLPDNLLNRNVLVEVTGGGKTKASPYYSNSMTVQVTENYGQLRVSHEDSNEPVSKAYVKVYARRQGGEVKFYKDGYTDLRGRFDYASLNTNDLDFVDTFSILVLSDEQGAVIREAKPPKR